MTLRDFDNYSCPRCGVYAPPGTSTAGWNHHMATCQGCIRWKSCPWADRCEGRRKRRCAA